MKIGIDFDDTLVNTTEVSKIFFKKYMKEHNLENYHNLGYEQESKLLESYYLEITQNVTLFDYAKEALKYFKECGYKIYLVTARGDNVFKLSMPTKMFLKKNGIDFDGYLFLNSSLKGQGCLDNDIDLLIDNSDEALEDAKKHGISVLKYGEKSDKYDYALNWHDVVDYMKGVLDSENSGW